MIDGVSVSPVNAIQEMQERHAPAITERRWLRLARGWTLRDMALRANVSAQTVHRWELGATPSAEHAEQYFAILSDIRAALDDPAEADPEIELRELIASAVRDAVREALAGERA